MTTPPADITTRTLPKMNGIPVLGVLPQVWKDPLNFFLQTAIDRGGVVQIQMGPSQMILVTEPDAVKRVLQDNHKNYEKGYDKAKPLFGNGLLTLDGERWLRQRRLMSPAFSRGYLPTLLPAMAQATREKLDEWNRRPDPDAPVDMASEMMLLTQTIILRTMFGTDLGERSTEAARAFTTALEYLNATMMMPFEFIQKLPTPANRRFQRAMNTLDGIIYGIIEERRRGGSEREDLLAMLMQARDPETGEAMDEVQMRDEIVTIFLAGHETTASLLGWTWYLLSQHPEIEARLREEIDTALQGRTATYDDLMRLDYTRKVLEEALRMYPPAWMFARLAVEDDVLAGVPIKAGSMLMISPYVTHRRPDIWPEPERFDPERFTQENVQARHKFAYYPFSAGPRMCIGNNFALMEAPLLLTMIMQEYNMEMIPGQQFELRPIATLRPQPALYMRLTLR